MDSRLNFYLFLSGVATALVVMVISGTFLYEHRWFVPAMTWQLVILVLLGVLSNPWTEAAYPRLAAMAFWIMLPAIYALAFQVHVEFFFIYTIIWLACAPGFLARNYCWWAFVFINCAWLAMRMLVWQDDNPITETLLVSTFHAFALLSAITAKESTEANEKTQKLNRELLATQHLLGEASRESERTRIAHDLHDLLGHHLTALTINLQVAGRVSEGEAKQSIEQCHALAKLLLSDVREAVSALRDMPVVSLRELLEIAIRDIPRIKIDLDMAEDIVVEDVNTAQVLLRCVQESITNSLKHSNAKRARIIVSLNQGNIELSYTDNGAGCRDIKLGNGLQGMHERLEKLGGSLDLVGIPSVKLSISTPHIN